MLFVVLICWVEAAGKAAIPIIIYLDHKMLSQLPLESFSLLFVGITVIVWIYFFVNLEMQFAKSRVWGIMENWTLVVFSHIHFITHVD
jgi:hypothetical protein